MLERIAVVGAGANGAGIAADLVRAGRDVTLIEQWPAHVEEMRAHGVTVRMPQESIVTPVEVLHLCEVASLRRPFDLVLVLMKAYDTTWACQLVEPHLAADGVVVGLQNGMTMDAISGVVGRDRTMGAVIEVTSNMYEPGVINRQTPPSASWFALGGAGAIAHRRAPEVAGILESAGTVEISEDIRSSKWMKLVANSGELVTSAILNLPLAEAIRLPGMHRFMLQVCREAARTALVTGHRLVSIFGLRHLDASDPDRFAEQLLEGVLRDFTLSDTRTTVLQDWDKGRHSEVDELNGHVIAECRRLGITAPANQVVVDVAHRIEEGALVAQPQNTELLVVREL